MQFLLLAIILLCVPMHGMNFVLVDDEKQELARYYLPKDTFGEFVTLKNAHQDTRTYSSELPVKLSDINAFTLDKLGFLVLPRDVQYALDYLTKQHVALFKPEPLTNQATAAALYMAEAWEASVDIQKKLAIDALHNGYVDIMCQHILTSEKQKLPVQYNNNARNVLYKLLDQIDREKNPNISKYISIKTRDEMYETLYTSPTFCQQEKLARPGACDVVVEAHNKVSQSPEMKLFDVIHKDPKSKEISFSSKDYDNKGNYLDQIFLKYCYNSFLQLPLVCMGDIFSCTPKHFSFYNLHDPVITEIDRKYCKKYGISIIKFFNCAQISTNILSLPVRSIIIKNCTITDALRNQIKQRAYRELHCCFEDEYPFCLPISDCSDCCGTDFGKCELYQVMPRWWPLLKLGSAILFAGCTAAAYCYLYREAQAEHIKTATYLATRAEHVQQEFISAATTNPDAYNFVLAKSYIDTEFGSVVEQALRSINEKSINSSTLYNVSLEQYHQAANILKNLNTFFDNYISHSAIQTKAIISMLVTCGYGLIATIKQARRFWYGPRAYLRNRWSALHNKYAAHGSFIFSIAFEPFLLIESCFGLNEPIQTITIDKEGS